jgi:hypothetical protein
MVDDDDESDGDEQLLDGDPKANTNNLAGAGCLRRTRATDHVIRIPSQEQTGWRLSGLRVVYSIWICLFVFFLTYSYT